MASSRVSSLSPSAAVVAGAAGFSPDAEGEAEGAAGGAADGAADGVLGWLVGGGDSCLAQATTKLLI